MKDLIEFPVLETDRLILRKTKISDKDDIFEIFSDEEVLKYYDMLPMKNLKESEELIKNHKKWYEEKAGIRWAIELKSSGKVVGTCGFHNFDDEFMRAETGYELNKNYWRQGIMYEALSKIVDFAFNNLNLNRLEAVVDDVNEASKKFLLKLGYKYEGCLRKRFYFRKKFIDEHYFGYLKDEY